MNKEDQEFVEAYKTDVLPGLNPSQRVVTNRLLSIIEKQAAALEKCKDYLSKLDDGTYLYYNQYEGDKMEIEIPTYHEALDVLKKELAILEGE